MLLGNPFPGVTSAPELLPDPVGVIGQWLPRPDAGGSPVRSVAFFDGSAAGAAPLTLTLWAALGLAGVLAGGRRRPEPPVRTAPSRERQASLAG